MTGQFRCFINQAGKPSLAALIMLGIMTLGACATNPVTGKRELQLISRQQEIQIGTENYLATQQTQGGAWYADPQLAAYISRIGQNLARFSERPDLPYEFVVLNSSIPNAWALPGGKIAVNRGLLAELRNEAELAAVLGHEITHAAARHSAKSMERNLILQTTLTGLAITIGDDSLRNLMVGAGLLGTQLISQKYGRDAELESDYHGIRYMAQAGYDPQAAITLQDTFVRLAEGKKQNWLSGLFSSHPPSTARVQANRKTAARFPVKGKLNTSEYDARCASLRELQPQFQQLDQAMTALDQQNPDRALELAERVARQRPELASAWGIQGAALYARKDYSGALTKLEQAIRRNPDYFQWRLLRGLSYKADKQATKAKQDLEHSLKLLPTALAHNALGEIALAEGKTQAAREHFSVAAGSNSAAGRQARSQLQAMDKPR